MKTLVLFRHAKSSWKYAELKEFDRPLRKRGRKAARLMGQVLSDMSFRPDIILSSPAERAATTASLVANELGYDEDRIVQVQELYLESVSHMLEQVQSINDGYDNAILVGHNPGLTDLANTLTGDSIESIPTAGAYAIRFDIASWKDAAAGKGTCAWFERPSDYNSKGRKKHGEKKSSRKPEEKKTGETQPGLNGSGHSEETPAQIPIADSSR